MGETLTGSRFETHFGGKGANQAVMAGRIGAKVAMVACVGADSFGDAYISNLRKQGVECTHVMRAEDTATGVAQICVDDNGANFITIIPGANHELSAEDIVAGASQHIRKAKVMLCQLEVRPEATLAALRLGTSTGVLTIFNPAPADVAIPNSFLEASDIVCPNEVELAMLCSREIDKESNESVRQGALELVSRGAKNVVVTLGEKGALWVSRENPDEWKVFPAENTAAVDTVGAGDAFLGSLGAYLARGLGIEEAVGKAVRVATYSVLKNGAQISYPFPSDLPQDLRLPDTV
ncbi:unnamed protein product [Discosporangium mesarthrocarpum]